jgi:hypothetical protein
MASGPCRCRREITMIGLFFKSFAMLFVWTGLLMFFTSAGGSPLMLGELLLAVCGVLLLAARARQVS